MFADGNPGRPGGPGGPGGPGSPCIKKNEFKPIRICFLRITANSFYFLPEWIPNRGIQRPPCLQTSEKFYSESVAESEGSFIKS